METMMAPPPGIDRRRAQQRYVFQSMPGRLLPNPDNTDGDIEFFYEADRLLARERYLNDVRSILRQTQVLHAEDDNDERPLGDDVVAGLRVVRLREGTDTMQCLRWIHHGDPERGIKGLGKGVASLNHIVHLTGDAGCCPATDPEVVPDGTERLPRETKDSMAGRGVKVVVVDTALDEATRDRMPWLTGVIGVQDPAQPPPSPGFDRYSGHGTFVAGLVRTMAPAADVTVRALFNVHGAALETELVQVLTKVLEEDDPDIISMSAGTYTWANTGLLALDAFNEAVLRHHKGVVLVSAAGNDGDRKPFWPAAAPFAVSAGALNDRMDDVAEFSNRGGWVDVYAPGEHLINAFPDGHYHYEEPDEGRTADFRNGLAQWSGTSFSTPIVSGLIAARMSHTGENGVDAAAALIRIAQAAAQPGVGAVLMPK
jgi:subtilisin family serine protease